MATQKITAKTGSSPDTVDPKALYEALFSALGDAYWAASDLAGKDQIQGARDAVHRILTAINQEQLDHHTSQLADLGGYVTKTNDVLGDLQDDINSIVKRIEVASEVEDAITAVLSLAGNLL